jgi:hypothetical protein
MQRWHYPLAAGCLETSRGPAGEEEARAPTPPGGFIAHLLASRHHEGVRGGAALSDDEVLQQVRPAGAMSSCADGDAISVLWRPALRHIAAALALRWTAAAQLCIHTTTSCRQCSSIPHAT